MLRLFVILWFVLAALSATAYAQDECVPANIAANYANQLSSVTTLEALQAVQTSLASDLAACNGLSFSGEDATVLGPVEIPAGIYKAVATTPGFITVQMTLTDGSCDTNLLFALFEGNATDGAEKIYKSDGCQVLIEVSNVPEPWILEFQLIE